jgi:hypothetical protein
MVRLLSKKLPRHFWNEDKGLTSIFILLCVSNFLVIPFFEHKGPLIYLFTRIIWFILLIAGITTLSENRSQMRKFSIIPVLLILASLLQVLVDSNILTYFEFAIELAVFALLIGMVLVKVFEPGSVSVHRIVGSIVVYMLIGNVWAQVYQFIYIHTPGSLQFPSAEAESGVAASTFLYFSYTTLTTTGYGEILPLNAIARTVVIIEELIGVLYPVILIGRLVSLVTSNVGSGSGGEKK